MTLVDSCIILDVATTGPFTQKSTAALISRLSAGKLYAPEIVFAEVCYGYKDVRTASRLFSRLDIKVVPLRKAALFRAAKAFEHFNKRNRRTDQNQIRSAKRILPDFYIGALAEEEGIPLLTRDLKRKWTKEFPQVKIITV